MGFFQARILEWVALSFSFTRGCSRSRDWTHVSCVSCIAGRFFTHWAMREAQNPGRTLFQSPTTFLSHNGWNAEGCSVCVLSTAVPKRLGLSWMEAPPSWNSRSVHRSMEEVLNGTVGFKKRDDANKERKKSKEPGILPSARYTGNPACAVCPAVSSEPKDPTLSFPSQGLSVRLLVFLFMHALLQG